MGDSTGAGLGTSRRLRSRTLLRRPGVWAIAAQGWAGMAGKGLGP